MNRKASTALANHHHHLEELRGYDGWYIDRTQRQLYQSFLFAGPQTNQRIDCTVMAAMRDMMNRIPSP